MLSTIFARFFFSLYYRSASEVQCKREWKQRRYKIFAVCFWVFHLVLTSDCPPELRPCLHASQPPLIASPWDPGTASPWLAYDDNGYGYDCEGSTLGWGNAIPWQ